MITVKGGYKEYGYNDTRNVWEGEVISDEEGLLNSGDKVRVRHNPDIPSTQAAGPLVIEFDDQSIKVEEIGDERGGVRTFRRK